MRVAKVFTGVLLAIAVFLFVLTSVLHWVAFDLGFYEKYFVKLGVADDLQVDVPTLVGYARVLTEYLRGQRDSPNLITVVRGQETMLFGERELRHLYDVRSLFALSYTIRNLSALLIVLGTAAAVLLKAVGGITKVFAYSATVIICLLIILAILAASDFNRYFTLFHLVSFSNDLWLLDPATENLIVMFPEAFFAAAAFKIAGATFAGYLAATVSSFVLHRRLGGESQ